MKMTFRWFGENADPVPLKYIRQIPGMTGIMGFLDYKAAGEVWSEEEISAYIAKVRGAGLECEVIESVNVHEDIKLGLPRRDEYIDNYITTVGNLAQYGVKVVIYNFMPVLDWLRTDLNRMDDADGSFGMYYDENDLGDMTPEQVVLSTMGKSGGFSLPGWEKERLGDLRRVMELYAGVGRKGLIENYKYFLDALIPQCEKVGVKLSCHPDDPAWPLFGLPRLAHDEEGLARILALRDSPCNTLCVCTGSLGSNPSNDVPAIIGRFGKMNRVSAVHVRNIKHLGSPRRFRECSHLSADGDLDMRAIIKAVRDTCPDVYMRPDHGRFIWGETGRPGYGLYDRALGAAYLNGLWEGVDTP